MKRSYEFFKQIRPDVDALVADGCDVLIAVRHPDGNVSSSEFIKEISGPICYRFSELINCRTKLIDVALLLRDCFSEVVEINSDGSK